MPIINVKACKLSDAYEVVINSKLPSIAQKFVDEGVYTHPDFAEYDRGTELEFTISFTAKSCSLVRGSIKIMHKQNGGHTGWVELNQVWFSPDEIEILEAVTEISKQQGAFNIKFTGDSGYGKTIRAEAWALHMNMNFMSVECGSMRSPTDWWGTREYNDEQGTYIEWSNFAKAIQQGNTVILLDELNRTPAAVKNSLYALLDYRRAASMWNEDIVCGNNTIFIFTVNEGPQFTGTFMEDRALANRTQATIMVSAPPNSVETSIITHYTGLETDVAEQIVGVLTELRGDGVEADITTRTAINVANLAQWVTLRSAFKHCLLNNITHVEHQKHVMDKVNELCL